MNDLIPKRRIEEIILQIRGHRIIIDADLARLYAVSTKRLNEQVKRHIKRFPDDFMFQLTVQELDDVVANCDHLKYLKYSRFLPTAFTEHGVLMAANILRSPIAEDMSIKVVRVFVRFREILSLNKDLSRRIDELESRYDSQFKDVFAALRVILDPPEPPRQRLGFQKDD